MEGSVRAIDKKFNSPAWWQSKKQICFLFIFSTGLVNKLDRDIGFEEYFLDILYVKFKIKIKSTNM